MPLGSTKKVHGVEYAKAVKAASKHLYKASQHVNKAQKARSAKTQQRECMHAVSELVNGATLVGQAEAHDKARGWKIDNEDQLHQELYETDSHVGEFCTLGGAAHGAKRIKF